MQWFDIDKAGLAKLLERRGLAWAVLELVQNGWDEAGVTGVQVDVAPVPGQKLVIVKVSDDAPEGFKRLSDAWTLFAESYKKDDPTKRGRFNLGEKLVLALARAAEISTTTGTVTFDKDGRRVRTGEAYRTGKGSIVEVLLPITREQAAEIEQAARRVIPPPGLQYAVNGLEVVRPTVLATFETALPTDVADEDGVLRRRERKTQVDVISRGIGPGTIYEMGIPVVSDLDDEWSVNVRQRVPLGLERDNVPPTFLRRLRVGVLNAMSGRITPDDVDRSWVREAAAQPEVTPAAFTDVLTARFGAARVMYDPSDPEANSRAVAEGHTVVRGNQLNEGERDRLRSIRELGIDPLPPAGRLFPTAKPYSDDPNAPPVKVIPKAEWTPGMKRAEALARWMGDRLLAVNVDVRMVHTTNGFAACYGPVHDGHVVSGPLARQDDAEGNNSARGRLDFNLFRLGHGFFDQGGAVGFERVTRLLLHELAHHEEANHLSERYHEALCKLGARLAAELVGTGLLVDLGFLT